MPQKVYSGFCTFIGDMPILEDVEEVQFPFEDRVFVSMELGSQCLGNYPSPVWVCFTESQMSFFDLRDVEQLDDGYTVEKCTHHADFHGFTMQNLEGFKTAVQRYLATRHVFVH